MPAQTLLKTEMPLRGDDRSCVRMEVGMEPPDKSIEILMGHLAAGIARANAIEIGLGSVPGNTRRTARYVAQALLPGECG